MKIADVDTRVGQIDGLRALACLAVVVHHCVVHGGRYDWPIWWTGKHALHVSQLLSLGYIGVELFFVISGYCLTHQLLLMPNIRLGQYAYRRIVRIFPPYWIVYGTLAVIASICVGPPGWKYFFYGALLLGNLYNASFWTLVVELRWYLLLPVMVVVYRRWGAACVMAVAIVASVCYKFAASSEISWWPKANFVISSAVLYLPTFTLGLLLASADIAGRFKELESRWQGYARDLALLIIVLTALCLVPAEGGDFQSYRRIAVGTIGSGALLILALGCPVAATFLSGSLLQLIGRASYSIYLIHEPLVRLCYRMVGHAITEPWKQFLFFQGLVMPALVALGIVFHIYLELPVIKMVKRWFAPAAL